MIIILLKQYFLRTNSFWIC